MPDNTHDLEPRVATLEADMETVKGQASHQWAKLDKIQEDMGEVKEHLAKQNGSIPHIQSDMVELKDMMTTLSKHHRKDELDSVKLNTKNKIYLGIGALVGAALIGTAVKAWLPVVLTALFGLAILL